MWREMAEGREVSEIKAVLLIPAEGDSLGLLKEGPCGARPPMAHMWLRVVPSSYATS